MCRATTDLPDGADFTLSKNKNGVWTLTLSDPSWTLKPSHLYDATALVDYYPQRVNVIAEATGETSLAIAELDHTTLLRLIENGHTLTLTADRFYGKYDLEGSAKVIQRIRDCFDDQVRAKTPPYTK